MMKTDFFGIGTAVKGAIEIYFRSARRSGRTNTLLENLNSGDRVYFAHGPEAMHFQHKCKDLGLDIECLTIPVNNPDHVFHYTPTKGRAYFDHDWLEEFYKHQIAQCQKHISTIEEKSSNYGQQNKPGYQHSKQAKRSMQKWDLF